MHQHHPYRHLVNRAAAWAIEQLEQRTLLSGGVFEVSKVPSYTPTSADISDTKNGPLANLGANLTNVYSEFKKFVRKGGTPSEFVSKDQPALQIDDGRVAMTVRTRGSVQKLADRIHVFGGELIYRDGTYHTVDAWVPVSQLSSLARDATVLNATPAVKPSTNFKGIADNQGDPAENADSARATFDVDGTGVKVGVISDSVNQFEHGLADSVATGDLPKGVQVIDDTGFAGTDEGRAMLEEIHDIAPGASLAFAASGNTQDTMAHAIIELTRAGCNVIVDDVGFADEPFFQEGIISQAITDSVENHGVTYLSAAGNQGQNGFQINNVNWVTDINGRTLLDFDPSDKVDTRNRVTIAGGGLLTLEWDNPYNGIVGATNIDLDINLIDPTTGLTFFRGNTANLITGTPIELVGINPGVYDIEISVADKLPSDAPLPTSISLNIQQSAAFTSIEYPATTTTLQGHGAGQDTISIGAVPFNLAPPFNSSQAITNENFSGFGQVEYLFTSNGQRRHKPLKLLKPDVSGIDGVNTSFFGEDTPQDKDKLPNFFGTSAAAPNVAAVVALMKEFKSDATPAEIHSALIESAKANPVNGQKAGSFDPQAGFGLIDGLLALHYLDPTTVVADIGRVVPDSVTKGVDQLTIRFSDPVTGFSLDDLSLTRGASSTTNLLPEIDAKLTTKNHQTWTLSGLGDLTSKRGTYFLTFSAVGVLDRATQTHPALGGATSFFVNGKPTGLVAIPVSGHEIDLSWTDNTFNDSGFVITRAIDPNFTRDVRTFRVKTNVSHYKDTTGLSPTTRYFYKVRAIVNDGAPNPSTDTVNVFTLAANETVVDNRSLGATVKGAWNLESDTENAIGGDYLATTSKGTRSVTYTPDLDASGTYFIYIRSIKGKGNATNVAVDLLSDGDVKKTFTLNERVNNGWVLLGSFDLPKGTATSVRVRNTGANGTVIADAVRFQRNA